MKTSDIGLVFDNKLLPTFWADMTIIQRDADKIWFGTVPTGMGNMTVMGAGDSLCYLGFEQNRSLEKTRKFFPAADLSEDTRQAKQMTQTILDMWTGTSSKGLQLIVNGTPFQRKVWDALMLIPMGYAVSYGTIADYIGSPKAVRAVGTAVGANPISLLIPCHRVVQQSGKVENYGWGDAMKQKLLKEEVSIQTSKNPASRKTPQVA